MDESEDRPPGLLVGNFNFVGVDTSVSVVVQEVFGKDLVDVLFFVHDGGA